MKNLYKQIQHRTWDHTEDQIWYQVWFPIWNKNWRQIRWRIGEQIIQIRFQIENHLEIQTRD